MDKNRISFSQYRMWRECNYKWKLNYVDKLGTFDQSIHTIFGTAVHRVLQDWMEQDLYGDKTQKYATTVDLSDKFKEILMEEAKPHIKTEDGFLFTRQELEEFYHQGCEIIQYVQKNQEKFFPTKDTKLYAIEHELNADINDHVYFIGYIDVVTYNEKTGEYTLYDLKTSSRGWNQYAKKDKKKTDQLLLYKIFFAKEMNIAPSKINVVFTILKRILTESQYPIPRVSEFSPASGPPSMKKAWDGMNEFVDKAFFGGEYDPNQIASPSKNNCKFCEFSENGVCEYSAKKLTSPSKENEWVSL